jgi:hypothetical protein
MPDDSTPLGDAMTHRFPQQKFPQRKRGRQGDASGGDSDISRRPPLPEHPQRATADLQDDESGRAQKRRDDDGMKSLKKQQG